MLRQVAPGCAVGVARLMHRLTRMVFGSRSGVFWTFAAGPLYFLYMLWRDRTTMAVLPTPYLPTSPFSSLNPTPTHSAPPRVHPAC